MEWNRRTAVVRVRKRCQRLFVKAPLGHGYPRPFPGHPRSTNAILSAEAQLRNGGIEEVMIIDNMEEIRGQKTPAILCAEFFDNSLQHGQLSFCCCATDRDKLLNHGHSGVSTVPEGHNPRGITLELRLSEEICLSEGFLEASAGVSSRVLRDSARVRGIFRG